MADALALGYDLSCVTDLTGDMAEVSGRTCLAQGIARRLQTPRGGLIDDPNYGHDLRQYVNGDVDARELARLTSAVNGECLKDERVLAATSTIAVTGRLLTVTIELTDGDGPFTLVLAVDAVSAAVLAVR